MNGFSPLFPSRNRQRQLLALAIAGWLGLTSSSGLIAQESEAPAAPPAIPSEEVPVVKPAPPVAQRSVKPYSRSRPAVTTGADDKRSMTRLIPTGPEDQQAVAADQTAGWAGKATRQIPTDVRAKTKLATKSAAAPAAKATIEAPSVDEPVPVIEQVQAEVNDPAPLVPGDGLEAPALETPQQDTQLSGPEVSTEEPAVPTVPNDVALPAEPVEEPTLDSAPPAESEPSIEGGNIAPARDMPAIPFEPAVPAEEVESEPAPLDDRAANSQPVPTDFNISRTAAADSQPYNDAGVTGFSPKDTVHTVGSGESFWTIAKKHYRMGRYSAALAEYNKSRIPKPDRIKPGMKVIVPPVETLEQKFGHLISGYVTPANAAAAAAAKPGFFVDGDGQPYYRVGEGDTLSDIAHNHLGRSSRWIQIVGLNKDRLPNPDAMKPGMVLRLPQDASEMVKAER